MGFKHYLKPALFKPQSQYGEGVGGAGEDTHTV